MSARLRRATISLTIPAVLALTGPGLAEPPGHAKKGWKHRGAVVDERYSPPGKKAKKRWKSHKRRQQAKRWGGPPPWAPAHGYRRKYVTYRTHDHRVARVEESRLVVLPDSGIARCNRDIVGAIFGGAAGAAVGSRFGKGDGKTAATIGGAILGALIGGNIGRAMDQVDQNCIGQALERAENGRPVAWRNPDNGGDYQVTPTRTYQSDGGRYCREYTTTIVVGGRTERAYGTACRQPDGSWQRQS